MASAERFSRGQEKKDKIGYVNYWDKESELLPSLS